MAEQPGEGTNVASHAVALVTLAEARKQGRQELRAKQLRDALQELEKRLKAERSTLSQELRELSVGRTVIKDQLWSDWVSSNFENLGPARLNLTPEDHERLSYEEVARANQCLHVVKHYFDGKKESEVDACFVKLLAQGEDGLVENEHLLGGASTRDGSSSLKAEEEVPPWLENVIKAAQKRDFEKEKLLKELLRAREEPHVEFQCLLEVLDQKQLKRAYALRQSIEDPYELKKWDCEEAEKRAGLWRFLSKKRVEAEKRVLKEGRTSNEDKDYVDGNRLGVPAMPVCYEEIKNLLDIENNPLFNKALVEWNRKEELFNGRVERKKNRVASLKNEVYQLIGFFSVFQGVVLTAVAQSNYLYCSNIWSPISLSALASTASVFGVLQKLF